MSVPFANPRIILHGLPVNVAIATATAIDDGLDQRLLQAEVQLVPGVVPAQVVSVHRHRQAFDAPEPGGEDSLAVEAKIQRALQGLSGLGCQL
eukprot:6666124-Pyramimonas_sp.AAC.1